MNELNDKIDALVDGELDAQGVMALGALIREDPQARTLVDEALAQHRVLSAGVEAGSHIAETVELPERAGHAQSPRRARQAMSFTGWAAAAVLAIIVAVPQMRSTPAQQPLTLASLTPDQYLAGYFEAGLQDGRVLGELPAETISVEQGDGDSANVTYVRRIVERRTVQDLYRLGQDELGNTVAVRVPAATVTRKQSL